MSLTENRTFSRGEVFPSYVVNRIQDYVGSMASNFRVRALNNTTVQVPASAGQGAAIVGIGGRWRWVEASVTRAMPGGSAGVYAVFVTASDNTISSTPQPNTDNTDYTFGLAVTTGANPVGVALFRQVATVEWDGTKITAINPLVYTPDNTLPIAPTADLAGQTPVRINGPVGGGGTADLAQYRNQAGGTLLSRIDSAGTWTGPAALSGAPTAPTASPGTNTTQIATTAFVTAAVAASTPVGAAYLANNQTFSGTNYFTQSIGLDTFSVGTSNSPSLQLSSRVAGVGYSVQHYAASTGVSVINVPSGQYHDFQIAGAGKMSVTTAGVTIPSGSGLGYYINNQFSIVDGGANTALTHLNGTAGGQLALSSNQTSTSGLILQTGASGSVSFKYGTGGGTVTATIGSGGINSVSGYQVNGVALAASHLSNGVTGSGAVALASSPTLSGTPLAPTAAPGTNTTQIATTAFVTAAVTASAPSNMVTTDTTQTISGAKTFSNTAGVKIDTGSGTNTAVLTLVGRNAGAAATSTLTVGTTGGWVESIPTGQTFSWQINAVTQATLSATGTLNLASGGQYQINGAQIAAANLSNGVTGSGSIVLAASPTLTGTTTVATLAATTLSGTPNFSGAATGQTAAVDTNTTQLATTAFVLAQAASATPLMDGTAAVGTSTRYARGDHVHPTDTSRAPTASPTLSGTVTLPSLSSTSTTLGFYGVAAVARPSARTLSNWTSGSNALRSIDRNSFTLLNLFDFVMTMANDLQLLGLYA